MSYLGKVIEKKRKEAKLSRDALSKDICSKEYIYLVEKGKRIPSIQIIKAIGNRLDVDFLDYLDYLDAEDPILVKDIVDDFVELRQEFNYKELNIRTGFAEKQPDFQKLPYKLEIEFNKIVIDFIRKPEDNSLLQRVESSINLLNGSTDVEVMPNLQTNDLLFRLYSLLAFYYDFTQNIEEETKYITVLYKMISPKKKQKSFHILYITLLQSYIKLQIKLEKYNEALRVIDEVVFFQKRNNYLEKLHLSYYLSFKCKEKMGMDSREDYEKANYLAKALERENDFKYIDSNRVFQDILIKNLSK